MKYLNDFRNFALRGQIMDLAIGVTMGTAFVKVVNTFVNNIIMPPIGLYLGNVDFSHLRIIIKHAGVDGDGEVAIGYGLFVQDAINFLVMAWAIFIVYRGVARLRDEPKGPASGPPSEDVQLLREIRDLLRVNKPQG